MIVVYNETNNVWNLSDVNEHRVKYITTRKIKNKKTNEIVAKTIGLSIGDDPELEDIDYNTLVEMNQPQTILKGNSNVLFRNKDCRPYVTVNHKYNKDILFINIDLQGCIVKNINTKDVFILSNFIVRGELGLIVAISDKSTSDFTITIYNKDTNMDTIYTFKKEEEGYSVDVSTQDVPKDAEVEMFKLLNFRPAKPTHLIFTHRNDFDSLLSLNEKMEERHDIRVISTKNQLLTAIEDALKEGYSAATLYSNVDNIHSEDFNIYVNNFNIIRKKFYVFNLLLNNGKTLKR